MAKILYLGNNDPAGTSRHRADALRRLGHEVIVQDPDALVASLYLAKQLEPFHVRTGYVFVQHWVMEWLTRVIEQSPIPDLIWVNSGEKFGRECLKMLKQIGVPIVLYSNDDPTGGRDGRRFDSLIKALPYYDLCAVVREVNVAEFKNLGAKKVIRIWMSYDEVVHRPFAHVSEVPQEYWSDIVFIGTWMRHENRDEILLSLINKGFQVAIYGNRWEKSKYWKDLRPYFKGHNLSGRNYVAAIQGAKVCLGLLSKGNRDMHTQRSLEVPYAGGLFCAERTLEHSELYVADQEAVFWSNPEECALVCEKLLNDKARRQYVLENGMARVRQNKVGNEDACFTILKEVGMALVPTNVQRNWSYQVLNRLHG